MSLSKVLTRLEVLLSSRSPRAHRSLRPPASEPDLARLHAHFGGAPPPELDAWYQWHDGQRGTDALHPKLNFTAHPIDEALRVHAALSAPGADRQAPWDPTWLPLFHNGAGDQLVYAAGALLAYRHDDPARPGLFESLEQWAKDASTALQAIKPRKVPQPGRYDWTPLGDEVLRPAQLDVGTVLCARSPRLLTRVEAGKLVGAPGWLVEIYVKLQRDQWMRCVGHEADVETATASALAQWASFSDSPPSARSGYYLTEETFPALAGMWRGVEGE